MDPAARLPVPLPVRPPPPHGPRPPASLRPLPGSPCIYATSRPAAGPLVLTRREAKEHGCVTDRRKLLLLPAITIGIGAFHYAFDKGAAIAEFADMPALRGKDYGKTKMRYPDYTETESGLQYKDLRVGDGPSPKKGETVVVDWDGYTIGYYGRIFEARNKTKGGSFEGGDKDFFKFKVGSGQVIPAFEEAISGMAPGGVRRALTLQDNCTTGSWIPR
ncbi:hypothetical protein BS78_05G087100 [Paspalum vaginatum]|nr:hypothetical protein BS78_05G087100 [Paspalum vaginatum]